MDTDPDTDPYKPPQAPLEPDLFEIVYAILLLTAIYLYAYKRSFIWARPGDV